MKIKSYSDLTKLVKKHKKTVIIRETGIHVDDNIEVLVGLGDCGLRAGADKILEYLNELLYKKDITNVRVVRSQNIEFCDQAPTVEVKIPGQESVLYGKVDKKVAKSIVEKHIAKNELVKANVITA